MQFGTCRECSTEAQLKMRRCRDCHLDQSKMSDHRHRYWCLHRTYQSYLVSEMRDLREKCQGKCLSCGNAAILVADHIVPMCLGGPNTIDNIQLLCRTCNASKGHRVIKDYRTWVQSRVTELPPIESIICLCGKGYYNNYCPREAVRNNRNLYLFTVVNH